MLRLANFLVSLSLWFLLSPSSLQASQHALLIGVSDYTDPRIPDLEGPVNDVDALHDVLVRNWQFEAENITVLIDSQATEAAILHAMDELQQSSDPGDDIIIYYSGHGTSASDPDLGAHLDLPDGSGAIVGSDFNPDKLSRTALKQSATDGLLVGRFEIKPRLEALDADRNVLVIFDACFSGNATREVASDYKPVNTRRLNLGSLLSDANMASRSDEAQSDSAPSTPRSWFSRPQTPFSYKNTVYFGAAAENQFAVDFSNADIAAGIVNTIDGKAHGGFTDSLLRALWAPTHNTDMLSFSQLFNRTVNQFNIWCKVCGHTPVSLPSTGTSKSELMGRVILNASALLANNTEYAAASEAILNDALIVDAQFPDDNELAMKGWLPARSVDFSTLTNSTSPDLYLKKSPEHLSAYAADGQLITQMPGNAGNEKLSRWLKGRQWLKSRMTNDMTRENGNLQVSFRHPLASNRVTEGESIYFNILNGTEARLLVLLLDAKSELSLLYPVNDREQKTVLTANSLQRIPAEAEPLIQVQPPWGTDTILFYTLPTTHELDKQLQQLRTMTSIPLDHPSLQSIEAALAHEGYDYAATTIRIVSEPTP